MRWFRKAAETGDAEALNMLGRCYENGWGVKVDFAEAAGWFAQAADLGDAWAEYNLGHLYLNGAGVKRDPVRALDLYRRSAARGHARAMNLVGRCLEHGWGCDANLAEPNPTSSSRTSREADSSRDPAAKTSKLGKPRSGNRSTTKDTKFTKNQRDLLVSLVVQKDACAVTRVEVFAAGSRINPAGFPG